MFDNTRSEILSDKRSSSGFRLRTSMSSNDCFSKVIPPSPNTESAKGFNPVTSSRLEHARFVTRSRELSTKRVFESTVVARDGQQAVQDSISRRTSPERSSCVATRFKSHPRGSLGGIPPPEARRSLVAAVACRSQTVWTRWPTKGTRSRRSWSRWASRFRTPRNADPVTSAGSRRRSSAGT